MGLPCRFGCFFTNCKPCKHTLVTGHWIRELKGTSALSQDSSSTILYLPALFIPITPLRKIPLQWLGIIFWPKFTSWSLYPFLFRPVLSFTLKSYSSWQSLSSWCIHRQHSSLLSFHILRWFKFSWSSKCPFPPCHSTLEIICGKNGRLELYTALHMNTLNSGINNSFPSANTSFEVP